MKKIIIGVTLITLGIISITLPFVLNEDNKSEYEIYIETVEEHNSRIPKQMIKVDSIQREIVRRKDSIRLIPNNEHLINGTTDWYEDKRESKRVEKIVIDSLENEVKVIFLYIDDLKTNKQ